MKKNRNQKRSQERSKEYQKLEPRHMLAAVSEPFADNAVTVDQMIERARNVPFVTGEVVVAIKADVAADQAASVVDEINWTELTGADTTPIRKLMSIDGDAGESVSLVHLDIGDADLFHVMRTLDQSSEVMWSAPNFVHAGDFREFIPNDPDYANQYHHPLMRNDHAWDIEMGDADIIVGITDDGVELGHEDLADNIWVNPNEIPGNGIDDDSNGYVDDVNGWDFAGGDNNPDSDGGDHGTHVAGITAAVSNNGVGIAGVAGGSTIMPLKFTFGPNAWTSALINETLAYGVDNGSQIINTSYRIDQFWGDPVFEAGLQYVHDNNALHFNSAGNGFSIDTPRQNFDQTILVANTDRNDRRNSSSNIGYGVDISSPGTQILSTVTGGGYANFTGTSMAAPDAAGVAALIWSHNPTWTNVQVAAQLMATADFIDDVNPGIEGTLGSGRTNAFRALTETLPAPTIKEIGALPADGTWVNDTTIDSFSIRFDQVMDLTTTNNSTNYRLIGAGNDGLFGTADDDVISINHEQYMIGTNVFEFQMPSALDYGQYRFTISGLTNPFGTGLDGNGDGFDGDTYVHDFRISRPGMAVVSVNQEVYRTEDTVVIELTDDNLAGSNPVVTVMTDAGDNEQVTLTQVSTNRWTGTIDTQPGLGFPGDNFLNVFDGDEITVHYLDGNDGLGNPFASSVTATVMNQLVVGTDPNQPIDDTGTIVSTINITEGGSVGDLNVMVDISHGRTSDLSAVLVAPNGTRVSLFSNVGTDAGENFTGTILDNDAEVSITTAGAPFRGRFQPAGDLSSLQGLPITGTWRLEVSDEVSGVTGNLNDWGLQIQLLGGLVGTPGDDVIVVDMRTESVQVTINGVTTDVGTETAALSIDALAGNDTLTFYTDHNDNSVTIRDYLVSLTGGFNFTGTSIENARIVGQGGDNRARIFGTNADDFFRNFANGSSLVSAELYDYSVVGFHEVSAFSFGGNDEAVLMDTPANDRFYGTETYSRLSSENGFVHIRDFDDVRVNASQGGFDIAQFVGGNGDDAYWANTGMASFTSATDFQLARNFERTWAKGGLGNDTARLIGSPGNDRLISHPNNTFMRGNGFLNQVLEFDHIVAIGGDGVNKAFIHDTHGDDTFYATPTFVTMNSPTMTRYARDFQETTAYGSAGFDRATFIDSADDDRYIARSDYAFLTGPGFMNQARNFNSVTARSSIGNDVAIFYASSDDARFFGTEGRAVLNGPTYFNQALNFANVTAQLSGSGYQHAVLVDSSGNDTLIARDNLATIYGTGYRVQVFSPDRVFARSINGGLDQIFATENLQYDLEVFGGWGVG